MTVTIVAAVAANGVIGRDGGLPWHLPEDMAHFKRITMGHALLVGRRTYESFGRPLPGRTMVVVTRQPDWRPTGVEVVDSVAAGLDRALDRDPDPFVGGGSEIFRLALPLADRLALTLIDDCPEGDTYFPDVDWTQWQEVRREPGNGFAFVDYARASGSGVGGTR